MIDRLLGALRRSASKVRLLVVEKTRALASGIGSVSMDDTPLHKAETPEAIERLLDAGWKIESPGWMGATPLHGAAQRGLADVALALIRRGADVDARRPDRRDSPLHFAADAEVARVLIEHGADIEARD